MLNTCDPQLLLYRSSPYQAEERAGIVVEVEVAQELSPHSTDTDQSSGGEGSGNKGRVVKAALSKAVVTDTIVMRVYIIYNKSTVLYSYNGSFPSGSP